MATGVNRKTRTISTKQIFPDIKNMLSSAVSFDQGDLLYFDTTNKLVKRLAAEGDALTFLGVAPVTVVSGKVPPVYSTDVDASVGIAAQAGPEYGDVYSLVLKTGDAFVVGQLVYADPVSGNYHVQTAGTKAIGIYQGIATTATAGQKGEILIGARYPADTLQM